jgi:hypothetical protein
MSTPILDRPVTVCASCERACCWQGQFMCDEADMAGTNEFPVRSLRERPRGEHYSYWFTGDKQALIEYEQLAETL